MGDGKLIKLDSIENRTRKLQMALLTLLLYILVTATSRTVTDNLIVCMYCIYTSLLQISNNHVNVREQNGADRQTDVEQT